METKSIEERAIIAFPRLEDPADVLSRHGYIEGATEQDRISRQEERERCIRIELGRECRKCSWDSISRGCRNYYIDFNPAKCQKWRQIREAMEGGEG